MSSEYAYNQAIKHFAGSKLFFKLFDETIALVQKTSDYLEGTGRFDQLKLEGRNESFFATESIKMTNRLVFASSWLLAHRAYYKGELDMPKDINFNNFLDAEKLALDKAMNNLPARFTVLLTQSSLLFERIMRLDKQLRQLGEANKEQDTGHNEVHSQLEQLKKGLEVFKESTNLKKSDIIFVH